MKRIVTILLLSLSILNAYTGTAAGDTSAAAPIQDSSDGILPDMDTPMLGVNLSSASGGKVPGTFGRDYIYPRPQDLHYFKAKGVRLLRLPFRAARFVEDIKNPAADYDKGKDSDFAAMKAVVAEAERLGMWVFLDAHDFAERTIDGTRYLLGDGEYSIGRFARMWGVIAAEFKDFKNIWGYDLQNEPKVGADVLVKAYQAAIDEIRKVDTRAQIIVEGPEWASAYEWIYGNNPDRHYPGYTNEVAWDYKANSPWLLAALKDPQNKIVFQAHGYFDPDNSGTYKGEFSPVDFRRRFMPFLEWCRTNGAKGLIGEFGVPFNGHASGDPRYMDVLDAALRLFREYGVSATYWCAGSMYDANPLTCQPDKDPVAGNYAKEKSSMKVLEKYFTDWHTAAPAKSLEEVRASIRSGYLEGKTSGHAGHWASAIRKNGRWSDIDYNDDSRSLWQLEKHVDRLVDMALSYEQAPKKDPRMHKAIIGGLQAWFDGNFKNGNWWYAKIGIPRRMLALAYILDDDLPAALRDSISSAIAIIDSDDFPARPGGDRIQVLSNHAKVLMWRRDYDAAASLFKKIEAEARIAPFEEIMYDAAGGPAVRNTYRPAGRGVQADMTFHHRGDRVNSTLTYGMELPEYFSYWGALLSGTGSSFSPQAIHFVIDYYLDAVCRHLVAGLYAEPSIMNRELARPGEGIMHPQLAEKLLAIAGGYRADELRHFAEVQSGRAAHSASYAHHFWQSDYFVFSRPAFQTAVRIHSCRNANSEAAHNAEGLRNHFRGDGACMLSVSGREYADMAPVCDFRMIPGATTPLIPYEPLSAWGSVHILDNPTQFAGAVADSLYGAVAFDFISPRSDLRARKAWFFFDDEYLCLGSAISSSAPDSIVTTIEQCLSPQAEMERRGQWFFHAGSAYHVIDGRADARIEHRRGTWENCVANVEYATDALEADVFTLSIDHGRSPQGAGYAYAVVPGADAERPHSFRILANSENLQAVASADGSIIYMVFYAPGEIDTPAGRFSAGQPCMMMMRDGRLLLSDPARRNYVHKIGTPAGEREVLVPTGLLGGTAVEIAL